MHNAQWHPIINVDKLWMLVPEEEKKDLNSIVASHQTLFLYLFNFNCQPNCATLVTQAWKTYSILTVDPTAVRDLVKFGFIPSFCIFYYFSTSASFSILLISP